MEPKPDTRWEQSLEQLARRMEYPATPDLGRRATNGRSRPETGRRRWLADDPSGRSPWSMVRRPALALLLLGLVLALALLAAPPTRAALLALFARVGAIEIFVDDSAPEPVVTLAPPATAPAAHPAAGPSPTGVIHSLALIEPGEPVTLEDAAGRVRFTPQLPAVFGEPDEILLHRGVDLPAVTLVWRDGATPLSLTEIGIGEFARKFIFEQAIDETTVNGVPAYWLPGPHSLQLLEPWTADALPITSNVLIWTQDGITYRLEGDLALDEARAIAESVAAERE